MPSLREEKPRNMMQERNSARAKVCALKVECNKLRAEIEMWQDECREWQAHTHRLRKELAEAKAEIAGLRKRKAWWKHSVEAWLAEEQSWHEQMDELRAEVESLRTDAEIGRLVQGMKSGTSLRRSAACYHSWRSIGSRGWEALIDSANPAKALRAIQEAR